MSAELTPQARQMAIAELEAIEQTLSGMSAWVDGDDPDRQRCSIYLEDASNLIRAADWMMERLDRARVAMLAHRRVPSNGRPAG
jgi:hypothetical protein